LGKSRGSAVVNEGPFGMESSRKAVEIVGDVLKQPLQSKHTVLTQRVLSISMVGGSREGGCGEGFMEILRQSNRWCSGSLPDETRLPGARSQMDSRSEVSGSEV